MKRYVHPRARGRVTYGSLAVGEQPRRLPTHACTLGPPPALKAERRLEPGGPCAGRGESHGAGQTHYGLAYVWGQNGQACSCPGHTGGCQTGGGVRATREGERKVRGEEAAKQDGAPSGHQRDRQGKAGSLMPMGPQAAGPRDGQAEQGRCHRPPPGQGSRAGLRAPHLLLDLLSEYLQPRKSWASGFNMREGARTSHPFTEH